MTRAEDEVRGRWSRSDRLGRTWPRSSDIINVPAGVAQLVRARGSYPRCPGFKSLHRHHFSFAAIANRERSSAESLRHVTTAVGVYPTSMSALRWRRPARFVETPRSRRCPCARGALRRSRFGGAAVSASRVGGARRGDRRRSGAPATTAARRGCRRGRAFCARLAGRLGMPFVGEPCGRRGAGARERRSIEDAARQAAVRLSRARRVQLGSRGHRHRPTPRTTRPRPSCCGWCAGRARAGWRAIRPQSRARVIRPLLDVRRAEVRAYLAAQPKAFVKMPRTPMSRFPAIGFGTNCCRCSNHVFRPGSRCARTRGVARAAGRRLSSPRSNRTGSRDRLNQ